MLTISGKTNKSSFNSHCPENREELTVEQFEKLVNEWDGIEIIQAFSILSGIDADFIEQSKDGQLETAMYRCVSFLFKNRKESQYILQNLDLESLPIPDEFETVPLWAKDRPSRVNTVKFNKKKKIGSYSIGQAIQARRSLEDFKDLRGGISMLTAIYLQPLIDNDKYDHLRAIELQQVILKMPITKVFPIGFFLLRKLNQRGSLLSRIWNLLKQKVTKNVKISVG